MVIDGMSSDDVFLLSDQTKMCFNSLPNGGNGGDRGLGNEVIYGPWTAGVGYYDSDRSSR